VDGGVFGGGGGVVGAGSPNAKKARLLFPARAEKSRRADLGRLEVVVVVFVVFVAGVVVLDGSKGISREQNVARGRCCGGVDRGLDGSRQLVG
jgi:hypothetical protein